MAGRVGLRVYGQCCWCVKEGLRAIILVKAGLQLMTPRLLFEDVSQERMYHGAYVFEDEIKTSVLAMRLFWSSYTLQAYVGFINGDMRSNWSCLEKSDVECQILARF